MIPPRLIRLITPYEEPLTIEEVKIQRRIDYVPEFPDGGTEDSFISNLITTARTAAEEYTGRALVTQTWKFVYDNFADTLRLFKPPIQTVTVQCKNAVGVWQTVDTSVYGLLDGDCPKIYLHVGKTWPTLYNEKNVVEIICQCGYGDASAVPEPIKQWMLLKIGEIYENRERSSVGVLKIHDFVDEFLRMYCVNQVPYVNSFENYNACW